MAYVTPPELAAKMIDAGKAQVAEKTEEVNALFERLSQLGDRQRQQGRGPVKRAVGNLFAVLAPRFFSGEVDEEELHAIAAIIDDRPGEGPQ